MAASIEIIDRRTAIRTQRETTAGDVHVCITDTNSKNPHRSWWITETALNQAIAQGMTLDDLDRLFTQSCRPPRNMSLEYPVRDYYIALQQDNVARAASGESEESLWRWRSFNPTNHSQISAICRYDATQGRWLNRHGQPLHPHL